MCFSGLGIGHLELKSRCIQQLLFDKDLESRSSPVSSPNVAEGRSTIAHPDGAESEDDSDHEDDMDEDVEVDDLDNIEL